MIRLWSLIRGGLCRSLAALPSVMLTIAGLQGLNAGETVSFQRDIRPILSDACFACHGPDEHKREAELRLDQPEVAFSSGAIVPGDVDTSRLWERINSSDPDVVMPPPSYHKALTETQRDLVRRWIESGAKFEKHWSFEAPTKPDVPANGEANPIDAFLKAKLSQEGLTFSKLADRRTLLRRITLDLTGLPPTLDEISTFLADTQPDAYERWIDRLMSRTTYGEHMARYWLDLARYADTHGLHLDNERSMWPYRDWVVRAFHENVPFDDFTRWQLAGDLLDNPTPDQLVASGFNRCNVSTSEGGSINEEWVYRYAVDRTTTASEVWMGLTAGCAVCHDHKFDPLSTKEYYSMYAFFHSAADPAMDGNRIDTPPILKLRSDEQQQQVRELEGKLAVANQELKEALASFNYVDPATQDPPPEEKAIETIWIEDTFPQGAKLQHRGQPGQWINADQGPVAHGAFAWRRQAVGVGQDYYNAGGEALALPASATIVASCYIDPAAPPRAIMLQFHTDGWKHRAIWGEEDAISFGKKGTTERFYAGALPPAGEWVQLEISPTRVGLKGGSKITGLALTQCDGTVIWDHVGVRTKSDPTKDDKLSYLAWTNKNAGRPVKELPDDLRQLVRGKKITEWSTEEAKSVFDYWLEHFYVGGEIELAPAKRKKAEIDKAIADIDATVPMTFVMADLPQPRESFVMVRGAYDKPGEKVKRQVPSFLPPLPPRTDGKDFDRLDLANWLVSGEHPLTSRVTVNRFWQQFFGVGLVKTSGDFGSQGEPPSHPELLDWLACQFVDNDWDIKELVKLILTSKAYRQSALATPELLQRDPENRWLARGPRLRLDAEVLRDQALFVGGILSERLGGKGVKPYQPPNIWEPVGFGNSNTRNYTQGTGEDLYRRSLYTFLKRTAPPPFMSTFDAPNREQSCSCRERSNTPMQALQLMNDIQHVEAARNFAQRMMRYGGKSPTQRLRWGWEVVTARKPNPPELSTVVEAFQSHLRRYQGDPESAKQLTEYGESRPDASLDVSELAAYTLAANLLMNLDETITKN